jgi:peroxiredoxin
MSKHLAFFILATFFMFSCQQDKYFKLFGTIDNANSKVLFLERMDLNGNVKIDSLKLNEDGKFSFKQKRVVEPTFYRIKLDEKNFITLLVDTCAKIEIIGNGKNLESDYTVKNSLESNHIKILNRKLRATRGALDSLSNAFSKLSLSDIAGRQAIENDYNRVINDHKKFIGSFVMDNPRSFASYYALFQKLDNETYIMNVMDRKDQVYFATIATSLNLLYPGSERVKHLYQYVLSAKITQKRQAESEKLFEKARVGIPEIEESTINGDVVKLSSLKGKMVLLSFWASWDANSRKENGNLKKVYQKFKNRGFEIYQVSLDQSKILWELAMEEDGCTWINVSDLRFTDSYPAKTYNVKNLPSNYLISKEGEIIGKDLFGNRLEDKLGELLH